MKTTGFFRKTGRMLAALLAGMTLLAGTLPLAAQAAGAQSLVSQNVDLSRTGSVLLQFDTLKGDRPIQGADFSLYFAGELKEDSGLVLELTPAFADSRVELRNLTASQAQEAAKRLEAFAKEQQIAADQAGQTDGNGTLLFDGLKPGTYLVVPALSQELSQTYEEVAAFLVSVPQEQPDGLLYEVTVNPKVKEKPEVPSEPESENPPPKEPETEPVPTVPETEPETESETETEPETETEDDLLGAERPDGGVLGEMLPQTGMLRWPIPILATAGLVLFFCGWISRYSNRRERDREKDK